MARKQRKAAATAAETRALQSATQILAETLAATLGKQQKAPSADLKVGIRNISDNTIGIRAGEFIAGEPDIQLFGDNGADHPGQYAVISYALWLQLRKSPLMARGEIVRDDTVLGSSFTAGPPDRPEDIPASWHVNAIPNAAAWIAARPNEADLRADIDRITNESSLRRLRTVVDVKLRELEKSFGVDPQRAKKAVQALPSLYQMLDQLLTMKLERPNEE